MKCECCGRTVRLMCEARYCGRLCRQARCGHPAATRRAIMRAEPSTTNHQNGARP